MKTIDIISKGKSNFENVLASQQCVLGKSGLGFNKQIKNFSFSESFSNLTKINRFKVRNNRLFVSTA